MYELNTSNTIIPLASAYIRTRLLGVILAMNATFAWITKGEENF
jgi:hypothetical protein